MAKQPNRRVKSDDMLSVSSSEELEQTIFRIGQLQTKLDIATAQTNQAIEDAKTSLKETTTAINNEIKVLSKSAQIFFSANQQDIVPAGKKSRIYTVGEIGTRTPPLSVTVKNGQDVIDALSKLQKKLKLTELLSVKTSVNKPGLIKHREKLKNIPGITFNQKEQFFIKPVHVSVDHLSDVEESA
ncbi:host-nuclease inhibitor Gam family protein [Pseudoalteromonas sp. ASV78]|uniref:host-nuclease inhibitor Gam family protein n=1 Tax=Pseudoalteromonas sp. ASV78 TaxID=3397851 RepID=UPI0039FD610E